MAVALVFVVCHNLLAQAHLLVCYVVSGNLGRHWCPHPHTSSEASQETLQECPEFHVWRQVRPSRAAALCTHAPVCITNPHTIIPTTSPHTGVTMYCVPVAFCCCCVWRGGW